MARFHRSATECTGVRYGFWREHLPTRNWNWFSRRRYRVLHKTHINASISAEPSRDDCKTNSSVIVGEIGIATGRGGGRGGADHISRLSERFGRTLRRAEIVIGAGVFVETLKCLELEV